MSVPCHLQLPAAGRSLPLAQATGGRLCFTTAAGGGAAPTIVLSLPKAGTYFVAEILRRLGQADAGVHLAPNGFTDYRDLTRAEKLASARLRAVAAPLELTAGLVLPGQFAVGHIVHEWRTVRALAPFRKLLVTRAWRDCLASFARFEARRILADPERVPTAKAGWVSDPDPRAQLLGFLEHFGAGHSATARRMAGWRRVGEVAAVRYETLIGDDGAEAQAELVGAIAEHLGLALPGSPRAVLDAVIGTGTLSWSGRRTRHEDVWSPEAETLYRRFGGPQIDRQFGR